MKYKTHLSTYSFLAVAITFGLFLGTPDAVSAQQVANTDTSVEFDFPMQEGNFWIYVTSGIPSCMYPYRNCRYSKLEVTESFENDSRKCGVLNSDSYQIEDFGFDGSVFYFSEEDLTYRSSSGFQLCQEENRLYMFNVGTEIESSIFSDEDMIADFDRDETQPWVIAYTEYDYYMPYVLRRLIERTDSEPYEYSFASYTAKNDTDLDGIFAYEFVYSAPGDFRDGVGFIGFENGSKYERLQASYLNGVAYGDTTFIRSTSIEMPDELPKEIQLSAYPNPFNPVTTLNYEITEVGHTTIRVFDLHGREVATLVDQVQTSGAHQISFDARSLSSGIYLVELQSAGFRTVQKITLMK